MLNMDVTSDELHLICALREVQIPPVNVIILLKDSLSSEGDKFVSPSVKLQDYIKNMSKSNEQT